LEDTVEDISREPIRAQIEAAYEEPMEELMTFFKYRYISSGAPEKETP
jgi:hypothetical protein